jgi:hypothetical protein
MTILPRGARLVYRDTMSELTGFMKVQIPGGKIGWVTGEYVRPLSSQPAMAEAKAVSHCGSSCGAERWAVKTLTDQDASQISHDTVEVTISQLRALNAPAHKPQDARVGPPELTIFRVSGMLTEWGREGDGDYHLVVASPNSRSTTIIAEIPDLACEMVCGSPARSAFGQARQVIEATLGLPTSAVRPLNRPRRVVLTGVGFFDFLHGQRGVAPNGIELHPVLSIRIEN